ncbi:unnamed protein product [Lepidochelys kempii]
MHDPWLTDQPQTRLSIQVSGGKATSQDWSNQEIIVIHQLWQHQPDESGQGVNQVEVKDLLIHNHTHLHCLKKGKCFRTFLNGRILTCLFIFPSAFKTFFPFNLFSPSTFVSGLMYLMPTDNFDTDEI